jgi:hypothetical protein
VRDAVAAPDAGTNPSDERMIAVLGDYSDHPLAEELISFISSLSKDEQIDLGGADLASG